MRFSLEILVILWQSGLLGLFVFLFDLLLELWVHLDLWGQQSGHRNKLQVGVSNQLAGQPQERLLKVVVGLGGDVVVLQVLLPGMDGRKWGG